MYKYLILENYKIIALFFLLIPCKSYSQEKDLLLKGFIGKYFIVIHITYDINSRNQCEAEYYYKSQKKTISLDGEFSNNSIKLWGPISRWENDSTETFFLKPTINGKWEGYWKGNKNISVPVKLIPYDINSISHYFSRLTTVKELKKHEPYQYVLTSEISFKVVNTVCYEKNICFQVLHDELSDTYLFKMISGTNESSLVKINKTIDSLTFDAISMSLMPSSIGSFNANTSISYVNQSLIVLNTYADYDGGAHPDFSYTNYTIDIQNGEIIPAQKLLYFGEGSAPNSYSTAWNDYEENILIPSLENLFKQMNIDSLSIDECDYFSDYSNWNLNSWYPTKEGICLGAFFPRSNRACDNPCFTVLPYNLIRQYLNPKYIWPK